LKFPFYLSVATVDSRGKAVTKSDLVQVVYRCHGGISRRESAGIIDMLLDRIKKELRREGKVQVSGFGSFQVVWREARKGRNPKTGDEIQIDEKRAVVFRPSKVLVERLN
jgi:integration host factor subunit alpha